MALFAALIEFTQNEELRLQTRPVHREYLRGLLDAGKLALSGPWADDTGALIIYDAEDMAEAKRILDGDPYRSAGVIANATLKEWRVVLRTPWSNDGPEPRRRHKPNRRRGSIAKAPGDKRRGG